MMSKLQLTDSDREILEELLKTEKRVKIYKRLLFLKYRDDGKLNKEISEDIDVSLKTLTNWTNIFMDEGFDGFLKLKYEGRRVNEFEKYEDEILDYIEKNNVVTVKELLKYLQDNFSIKTKYYNLYKYLKKNSTFLTKKQN